MGSKSASLLTQTQRNRIRDEFGDLTDEKMRRDQQRIRERVRSGILDFQLLADYPDRQFGLAFDEISDDELRAALADTYIVVERLREHHDIDQEELIEEARIHTGELTDETTDTRTFEGIDLRTTAEVRQRTEDELTERFGPGRWDRRANGLMKLGVSAFISVVLIGILDAGIPENLTQLPYLFYPYSISITLLFLSAIGWTLIKTTQSLKHNILPAIVKLIRNPEAVIREAGVKLIKNPGETVRKSWEDL
jgi:hypothetical protein